MLFPIVPIRPQPWRRPQHVAQVQTPAPAPTPPPPAAQPVRNVTVLAPESGNKLRLLGLGFSDVGTVYTFRCRTRPVIATPEGSPVPAWTNWVLFGIQIRYNAQVDLRVVPVVDDVELTGQIMTFAAPAPADWVRQVLEGRFFAWGRKCYAKIYSNSLPGAFHLDGAYFDGDVQVKHMVV